MRFQIGDRVVHPVYGVGTVKTCTIQRFSGDKKRHYYEVATNGPTVWVPLDEEGATVLREVASKHTLSECRRVLTSRPVPLDKSRQMRQAEISRRLKDGSVRAMCEMLRDLSAESWRKPLSMNDDRLLRKISKAVSEEWAAAEGVTPASALREIEDLLQASRAGR